MMTPLREARCDSCSETIDRLFTGSVNPVFCSRCIQRIIVWLKEIDCLNRHPFGNMLVVAAFGPIRYDGWDPALQQDVDFDDSPYVQVNLDSTIYVKLLESYRK